MSKLFKLVLLGLVLSLLLAACAPAAPETEEATEEPEATEEAEVTEEAAETEEAATEEATETEEAATEEAGGDFTGEMLDATCEENSAYWDTVEATGEYEVTFTLCKSDPAFLSKIAFTSFAIQSPEWLEETGGAGALLDRPVGTGPYMVEDGGWARGESVTFTRFDDYWGDAAATQTLVFRWSAEAAARLLELQSGTVDGIDNPGPDDFETIAGDSELQLIERPALNVFYVGFTVNEAAEGQPMADVRVRQAIAMGIDRQRIVDTFYPVGSEVASHFTPCAIPNGCAGDPWYDFDPEAALALLDEAGYGDGFDTKIYYRDVVRGYLPQVTQVAQDIQAQLLENLGINAEIVVMESGEFIGEASAGNLTDGLHLLGWGADYPQITNFLDYHFTEANTQFGDAHPEIFEALNEGARIADNDEAEASYVAANNAIRELVPMIPIAHGASATAFRADVENAHASPLSNEYFGVMVPGDRDTFVWMQNAEPISLYCADESDGESLRACEQVTEALMAYEVGGVDVVPSLAESCEPNEDLTVWVCTLRQGVTFHDGTTFDANDVVFNWNVIFDVENPLHVGNTGIFTYPDYFFGLINKPAE